MIKEFKSIYIITPIKHIYEDCLVFNGSRFTGRVHVLVGRPNIHINWFSIGTNTFSRHHVHHLSSLLQEVCQDSAGVTRP